MKTLPLRKSIFTILLVLLPILNQYQIAKLQIMDIVAIIGIVWYFASGKHRIKANYALIVFILYIILDTIMYSSVLDDVPASTILIRIFRVIVLYIFFYFINDDFFDYKLALSFYTKVIYVITAIIIFQYLLYYATGNDINVLIPGMKINYGSYETSDVLMHAWHSNALIGYYRPCSFFLEPAMQAQYTLPWLSLALFKSKREIGKYPTLKLLMVTVGICLTTSSLGVLCAAILWGYFLLTSFFNKGNKQSGRALIMVPVLLIGLYLLMNSSIIGGNVVRKLAAIQSTEGSSATWRLLRGIAVFFNMDMMNQIIGCGYGNLSTFLTEERITTIYDSNLTVISYMNAASTLLCSLGIIGFILYAISLRRILFSDMNREKRAILICFIILMVTSSLFDSAIYFFIILLMQHMNDGYDNGSS